MGLVFRRKLGINKGTASNGNEGFYHVSTTMGKISQSMPKLCGSLKTVAQFTSSQDLRTCWWIHFLGTSAGDYHPLHTVLFERALLGRTACLSVGSRMPWLSPQVSTTGAGAGTGAAFWLLAGPPVVFSGFKSGLKNLLHITTSGHWTSQTPLVFHVFTGKWSRTPQRRLWAKESQIRKLKGVIPSANFRSSHMILIVTYSANSRYSFGNTLRVLFRQNLHFAFISFDICRRYCRIFCTDPFTRTPKCM